LVQFLTDFTEGKFLIFRLHTFTIAHSIRMSNCIFLTDNHRLPTPKGDEQVLNSTYYSNKPLRGLLAFESWRAVR
jgi:hypothetical protein